MSDSESRNWLSCFGWGCLAVVVIAVLGIGGCVAFFYKGGSDAHAAANTYLEAVQTGDYEGAFEILGPGFTEQRGLADFVAFEQAARAEMGSCGDWRMNGTSFNRESGRSMALLTYQRICDDGPVTVAFNLEQVDGEWLIQDIRYNEAVGPVAEVCAECGAVVPPGANFCPVCGAVVGSEPDRPGGDGATPGPGEPDTSDPAAPATVPAG